MYRYELSRGSGCLRHFVSVRPLYILALLNVLALGGSLLNKGFDGNGKKLIENGSGRLFLAAASAYVMSHPEMERPF